MDTFAELKAQAHLHAGGLKSPKLWYSQPFFQSHLHFEMWPLCKVKGQIQPSGRGFY